MTDTTERDMTGAFPVVPTERPADTLRSAAALLKGIRSSDYDLAVANILDQAARSANFVQAPNGSFPPFTAAAMGIARVVLRQAPPPPAKAPESVEHPTTHLATLQFANGGLVGAVPTDYLVHLIRGVAGGGTPGPTLCGIDRFADNAPGWSVGGGVYGPGMTHTACPGCVAAAKRDFPGLPVVGLSVLSSAIVAAIRAEAVISNDR